MPSKRNKQETRECGWGQWEQTVVGCLNFLDARASDTAPRRWQVKRKLRFKKTDLWVYSYVSEARLVMGFLPECHALISCCS